jgi:hypothetical protein
MDAFRLGSSRHVMLVLAKPVKVDALLEKGTLTIDSFPSPLAVSPGGRQLEVHAPFEIVVTGFRANEDTSAFEAC